MKKITKEQLYKRQITLKEIGEEGQQKLLETKVLVVGCGGLGNVVAVYLAASGIGEIHLVDFDTVSPSNLHRQVFYRIEDVGKLKAEVLAQHIQTISPFVKVSTSKKAVSKDNIFTFIEDVDYILDCTDSLPIKYLLNDACVSKDKPLIYGSLYKFDGYVASFNVKNSKGVFSTNLRDVFPESSKQKVPNCSEVGTLNTIVGIIGLMQANEVLKLVVGFGKPLLNELLIYNSLESSHFKMKLNKSVSKERIAKIFEKESYLDVNCLNQNNNFLITADRLRAKLLSPIDVSNLNIISVIEDINMPLPFKVNVKIPLSQLDFDKLNITSNKEHIIVCNRGISSYEATKKIKEKFPEFKILSLEGGITNY